jgi:hypothetical protein
MGMHEDGIHISPHNPWFALHYATTGLNVLGQQINPGQQLTRQQALHAYTRGNAWYLNREDVLGSIEKGKFADLVVLDKDYFTVSDAAMRDIRPILTVIDGRIVHDTGALRGHRRPTVVNRLSAPHALPMIAAMAATRRADMFVDLKDDPRENGPTLGDERTTLVEALRSVRLTVEMKCAGLDAEAMARRSVEPSTMSLLGLVRHLAEMERATFRELMAGQDVPRLFCSDTDRDGDFDGAVPDPQVVAEAWAAWRAEVDFATRFVAEAPSLDITGNDPLNKHGSGGGAMSLREALVGMIHEYARHIGHADLLRERIDGRIGQ